MSKSHTDATLRNLCERFSALADVIRFDESPETRRIRGNHGADYWAGCLEGLEHVVKVIKSDYLPREHEAPRLRLVRNESPK